MVMKKKKMAKGRLDRFFYMAREQGYRSRASFKLIQLNQQFGFLSKANVVLDLCAAPGSWLQVCSKFCPVSATIVGVDLVRIDPIRNVKTFTQDITTPECRRVLKTVMQPRQVDLVLYDGAPNMGTAWLQDAYVQSDLTLKAFKLACEFLREGGCFVAKVFRSKEYTSLLYVFRLLFDRVTATKPKASRNTSAEIYVVCRGFKAPGKIDAKMFDPNQVFAQIKTSETDISIDAIQKKYIKPNRAGYEDTKSGFLNQRTSVFNLLFSKRPRETMANHPCFTFEPILNASPEQERLQKTVLKLVQAHKSTTEEMRNLLSDTHVISRREMERVLKWRNKIVQFLDAATVSLTGEADEMTSEANSTDSEANSTEIDKEANNTESDNKSTDSNQNDSDEDETPSPEDEQMKMLEEQLHLVQSSLRAKLKRKKKKSRRALIKKNYRRNLQIDHKGDFYIADDPDLFSLKKNRAALELADSASSFVQNEIDFEALNAEKDPLLDKRIFLAELLGASPEEIGKIQNQKSKSILNSQKNEDNESKEQTESVDVESENRQMMEMLNNYFENVHQLKKSSLSSSAHNIKRSRGGEFIKGTVTFGDDEESNDDDDEFYDEKSGDEVDEDQSSTDIVRSLRGIESDSDSDQLSEEDEENKMLFNSSSNEANNWFSQIQSTSEEFDLSSSDDDDDVGMYQTSAQESTQGSQDDIDGVNQDSTEAQTGNSTFKPPKNFEDQIEFKAIAQQFANPKKKRRMIEDSYNRYSHPVTKKTPKWLIDEENEHARAELPISKSELDSLRSKHGRINGSSLRKTLEFKARQKRHIARKLNKLEAKMMGTFDKDGVTELEKVRALKKLERSQKNILDRASKKKMKLIVSKKSAVHGGVRDTIRVKSNRGKRYVDSRTRSDLRQSGKPTRRKNLNRYKRKK